MTEGVRNAVLTNIVVVSLALLLSCCTNDRETKMLQKAMSALPPKATSNATYAMCAKGQ
jgi:hypothetical protein